MSIHNVRLWFLRNRNDIFSVVGFTCLLTILILQVIITATIYRQSIRNEEILKGLSCILLIPPPDRNKQNVQYCVDNNGGDTQHQDNRFDFTEPETPTSNRQSSIVVPPATKEKPKTTAGTNAVKAPKVVEAPLPVEPPVQIESQINPTTAKVELRVIGTSLWVGLGDG